MGSMRPTLALALLLALGAAPARAEDPPPAPPVPPAGTAPEVPPALKDAAKALAAGRYEDAARAYREAAKDAGVAGAARAGLARVLRTTGKLPEALVEARLAVSAAPGDPAVLALQGTLEFETGELDAGEATLRRAVGGARASAVARTALGDVLRARGKREEALGAYVEANDLWAEETVSAPEDLVAAARARFAIFELDRRTHLKLQATMGILGEAARAGSEEAVLEMARAFTKNDDTKMVPNTVRPLLDRNPGHPEALLAAAEAKVRRFELGEAAEMAERALRTDPTHPGAVEILALRRLGDGDDSAAAVLLDRGLAARPRHRALLALRAIPRYLTGDRAGHEAAMKGVLALDPAFGRGWLLLARVLEDRRRFAEAADAARRALAADPGDPEAWFSLARNLMNLGQEKEAHEALVKSDAADAFRDIFRENFHAVLDEVDTYAGGKTAHFDLRIHLEEDPVLRPLYEEALEESWRVFVERYGFTPQTPLLAEVFRHADDFSARTLGIPGFGAIGACFGRVITLDSPAALGPNFFSWRNTAHHEMSHVFTLQMSAGRVPRWLTEGLAVLEERRGTRGSERHMERELVSAVANGDVPKLRDLNGQFMGPSILWAYYLSGTLCGWMEQEYGWPKVLALVRAYGEDLDTPAAVRRALGVSPEELDLAFLEHLRGVTAAWKVRPIWSDAMLRKFRDRSAADPKDLEAHLGYAEACLRRNRTLDAGTALARARAVAPEDPRLLEYRARLTLASERKPDRGIALLREALAKGQDHFDLRMTLARADEVAGDAEKAMEHYRRAKGHFPPAAGEGSPRPELVRLLLAAGREEEATRELEEDVALVLDDVKGRLDLASVYEERKDWASAARVLREVLEVRPIPGAPGPRGSFFPQAWEVHRRLGAALAALGRPAEAARSFRLAALVARDMKPKLPPAAVAEILVEEARAALDAGAKEDARAALREALRLDPLQKEAPELQKRLGD